MYNLKLPVCSIPTCRIVACKKTVNLKSHFFALLTGMYIFHLSVTGYLMMTDDWFSEFVFEVVVDKKFLSEEMLDVLKAAPKVLPAWDPMGALACPCNESHNAQSHL